MKYLFSLILGICLVLSVCTAGCVLPLPTQQSDIPDYYAEQVELAHKFALGISNDTSALGNALISAIEYQSNFSADSPEVLESLRDLYMHNPSATSIYRVNADNVVVAAVPESASHRVGYQIPLLEFDPFNLAYPIYHSTYVRESTGETHLLFCVPVYTSDGIYDGFLCYVIDPKSKVLVVPSRSVIPREGVIVMVLDENGDVLYADNTKRIGQNAVLNAQIAGENETAAVMKEMLLTQNGTATYTAYSFSNMKYITIAVAWETLETRSGPLTIAVGKPITDYQTVVRPSSSTDETLEEFVQSAYLYAVKYGKDAAIETFNDPKSQFVTQQYTISAIDINGTILANPMLPGDVGVNLIANTDVNGVPIVKTLVQRAKQGGGYALYLHPDPMDNQEMKVKRSYVMPVDENWFIVAGIYTDTDEKYVDHQLQNAMVAYTRHVAQYAQTYGKDAAIDALNTPNGLFYSEDIRLVAVDSAGTILARPYNPELIGNSLLGATDIYGSSLGRDLVVLANSGGGMIYQYYPNRYTNENHMTLMYVLPIDDTWFLASGITMKQTP
ncbi:hypothetical protein McpSp1_11800 [Methanocorpusculaceae archaeon Sp1]|nr:hypothetical protein [Methanocorpusculaceae archaeon Sp1]